MGIGLLVAFCALLFTAVPFLLAAVMLVPIGLRVRRERAASLAPQDLPSVVEPARAPALERAA